MTTNIKLQDLENKEKIRIEDNIEGIYEELDFPKHTKTLINRANQTAQSTRPNKVGQLSDLVPECPYKTQKEWEEWYLERYPDAIEKATKKTYQMILNFKEAIELIDESMVQEWIEDLILVKSRRGIHFQQMILRYLSDERGLDWRLSTPDEEREGIDGFIGDIPVQVKPESYLKEGDIDYNNEYPIIFYKNDDRYLSIFYDDIF